MKVETRPLTPNERAVLTSLARPQKFTRGEWGGLLLLAAFAVSGLVTRGLLALLPSLENAWLIVWGTIFVAVFLGGCWFRARRLRQSFNAEVLQELNEGNAEACVIHVRKAVQVEEFEDEGPGFYLESEEGKTIFLQGQYLYDLKDFPSTRVEIVRAPRSRTVLDLKCSGQPVPVSSQLPPFTKKDHDSGHAHYDGDIVDRNIEEITGRK